MVFPYFLAAFFSAASLSFGGEGESLGTAKPIPNDSVPAFSPTAALREGLLHPAGMSTHDLGLSPNLQEAGPALLQRVRTLLENPLSWEEEMASLRQSLIFGLDSSETHRLWKELGWTV
jgi:hypothetical protein